MLVVIRGAGDLASGVALRLWHSGYDVIMTDLDNPTSIRRTVCFSEAIRLGSTSVEDISASRADSAAEALSMLDKGILPVISDPEMKCLPYLHPDALVDAILAKRNTGTQLTDAPTVIALGPGFKAGFDCHWVIETMRGHTLGRVIGSGMALPNTGVPGEIGGHSADRVIRAPRAGLFSPVCSIGDSVEKGQTVAYVDGEPVVSLLKGVLRGILPEGTHVHEGMKSGDVDPRCAIQNCFSVSDKSLSIAGGVLEALLMSGVFPDPHRLIQRKRSRTIHCCKG